MADVLVVRCRLVMIYQLVNSKGFHEQERKTSASTRCIYDKRGVQL